MKNLQFFGKFLLYLQRLHKHFSKDSNQFVQNFNRINNQRKHNHPEKEIPIAAMPSALDFQQSIFIKPICD